MLDEDVRAVVHAMRTIATESEKTVTAADLLYFATRLETLQTDTQQGPDEDTAGDRRWLGELGRWVGGSEKSGLGR